MRQPSMATRQQSRTTEKAQEQKDLTEPLRPSHTRSPILFRRHGLWSGFRSSCTSSQSEVLSVLSAQRLRAGTPLGTAHVGFTHYGKEVRQHVIAPHFQPASTERNQLMFREATSYFQHLKTVVRKLGRLIRDYDEMTQTVHGLLECRVPRVYTVESDGSVGAEILDGEAFLGTGVQIQRLLTTSQTLKSRMSDEVISTVQQWFQSYERCKMMLGELDRLKFELDSRRRTVLFLGSKKTEFESKVKEGDATKAAPLASATDRFQHKERKCDLCLSEFQRKEEELNQALRGLLSEILSDAPSEAHRAFKEGTSSGVQPPIHVTPSSPARMSSPEAQHPTNPFLTEKSKTPSPTPA